MEKCMSQLRDILAKSYKEGLRAVERKDWSRAVYWLEDIYRFDSNYEEVEIYYLYAAGMLAYEDERWDDAVEYLQALENRDFKDSVRILRSARKKQQAAIRYDQALNLIERQKKILPKEQRWDQIVTLLTEAKELDPANELILATFETLRILQSEPITQLALKDFLEDFVWTILMFFGTTLVGTLIYILQVSIFGAGTSATVLVSIIMIASFSIFVRRSLEAKQY